MIEYGDSAEGISEGQLGGFFADWGAAPSPAEHLAILAGSSHVILAFAGGRVVGFITAISDGVLSAYIPLLEVLPEHQGQGIGSELVRRMHAELAKFYMVDVL